MPLDDLETYERVIPNLKYALYEETAILVRKSDAEERIATEYVHKSKLPTAEEIEHEICVERCNRHTDCQEDKQTFKHWEPCLIIKKLKELRG